MIICARCGAAVGNIVDHYDVHGGVPKARIIFCPGGRYENAMAVMRNMGGEAAG